MCCNKPNYIIYKLNEDGPNCSFKTIRRDYFTYIATNSFH